MIISEGIYMLEIAANIMGNPSKIYPSLLWDGATAVLIDAGFPGQLPLIKMAIEAAGVPFKQLKTVILTHQESRYRPYWMST